MTFRYLGLIFDHILLPLCPLPVLPDQEIVSCIFIKIKHFLTLYDVSVKNLDTIVNIFLTWLSARDPLHNTIQAACSPKNAPVNMFQ